MMANLLQTEQLGVKLAERELVAGVSLSLGAGEILAVIGPNGAGKSSLLKALAGEFSPANIAGTVKFVGGLLDKLPLSQRAQQIAVLPQQSSLDFDFLVEEVIALGRLPHASGARRDAELVRSVAERMDVQRLLARRYPTLSGGEKQRVQLARVLAQVAADGEQRDRLLLLDEPLSALDIGHQLQVMESLRQVAAEGVAIVMVVHDVNIATRFATRVLALKSGRPLACGPVGQVLDEAWLETLFDVPVELLAHPRGGHPIVVMGD